MTAPALADARKQGAVLAWGNFITLAINFLIIAGVLFLVIRGMNKLMKKEAEKKEAEKAPEPTKQEQLLTDILAELKRK